MKRKAVSGLMITRHTQKERNNTIQRRVFHINNQDGINDANSHFNDVIQDTIVCL